MYKGYCFRKVILNLHMGGLQCGVHSGGNKSMKGSVLEKKKRGPKIAAAASPEGSFIRVPLWQVNAL